jgi:acetolactate synthase-1/2/3 large subunit
VLLLAPDLLHQPAVAPKATRRASLGNWPLDRVRPASHAIDEAATLIAEASRPVVLAGGGGLSPGAPAALARLQELASLPVITTNMGKGAVDEHHPLSCGVLGALTGPASLGRHTRGLLTEADLILEVGTRNNQNGTDSWRLIPDTAKLIQIDIDPQEIGRNHEAIRLVGDAAETLGALCDALMRLDLALRRACRPKLEARIADAWAQFEAIRRPQTGRNSGAIRPERVMAELQPLLTPETIVVADASYSSMWVVGQLRGLAPGMRFLTPRGLAGLGWGLPLAIGAKIARPASPVIAVVGDGGFAHAWAELETLVRMRVPVTVIVLNNGVLAYQRDAEIVKFGGYTSACHLAPVDHAAIARACGAQSIRIDEAKDIHDALAGSLRSEKPSLIEVITDSEAHPPLSLFDGTLDRA